MPLFSPKGKTAFVPVMTRTITTLQELGRTATRGGLSSLGKLVQSEVQIHDARVAIVPTAHIEDQFQHLATCDVGASFRFTGGLTGAVATVLSNDDARRLVDLLLGNDDGKTKEFGELETSALAEMTNITLNNALNAIGTENGMRFTPEVPQVATRLDAAFWGALVGEASGHGHAVLIETPFTETSRQVEGVLLVLLRLPPATHA